MKTFIYIEGSDNKENGNLRKGFSTLLSKKIPHYRFQIIMCNDKGSTIRSFKKDIDNSKAVLIDLDKHENFRSQELNNIDMTNDSNRCFFMVQQMEAWFLSQSDVCKDYFGKAFPEYKGNASAENNPSKTLKTMTAFRKQPYHKVKHGSVLLEKLDLTKLEATFPDVKRLINSLET